MPETGAFGVYLASGQLQVRPDNEGENIFSGMDEAVAKILAKTVNQLGTKPMKYTRSFGVKGEYGQIGHNVRMNVAATIVVGPKGAHVIHLSDSPGVLMVTHVQPDRVRTVIFEPADQVVQPGAVGQTAAA